MSQPSWIGKTLGDRYLIEEMLGQGGMSAVYKASDPNLRRAVAVKLIHPQFSDDPQFVSRFEEEAAAVAQLRHPNIIQVFDFDNDGDTYYMVLEFVPGESLQERLKRYGTAGRQMEAGEAIKVVASVCDALEYAHARAMIHRDIKPANIMLNVQGDAILMDFGIVKIVGGKQHTATGAVVGTAIYMSPEQIKGETIDARADIYALGVTLFEMIAGHPPFEADSAMTTMMMHVSDPVPDLSEINPDVPLGLVQVVRKALAKDRENRFSTAAEFGAALKNVNLHETATVESAGTPDAVAAPEEEAEGDATRLETPQVVGDFSGATIIEEPTAIPSPGKATALEPQVAASPAGVSVPAQKPAAAGGLPIPRIALFGGAGIVILILAILFGGRLFGGGDGGDAPPVSEATATSDPGVSMTDTAVAVALVEPTETPVPPTATETPLPTETPTATLTPTETVPPGPYVRINSITTEDGVFVVEYETFEYTEALPGTHVHFYYDTVTEANAGAPGSGPWILYGGPRPFREYTVASRPAAAVQMCARVANPNHSIILGSGNCFDLPESP